MQGLKRYSPIIRTIDAEIRGYEHLSPDVKSMMMPIFELTRSRPLKGYPQGDIHTRMSQLEDYVDVRPFVLDLTSYEDLVNDQIEDLLDESGDFREWREFLRRYSNLNIYPVVHFYEEDYQQLARMSELLLREHEGIAIRLPISTSPEVLLDYLVVLQRNGTISRTIVVLDGEYINDSLFDESIIKISGLIQQFDGFEIGRVIIASSSFPKSVLDRRGAVDHEGSMRILERNLFDATSADFGDSLELIYGDYGGAHPIRKTIPGGGWVPRVDVVTDEFYNYTRVRREEGGYKEAASRMINSTLYDSPISWGRDEIEKAAAASPSGKSPAFWISVRVNQHLTRMANLYGAIR